MTTATRLRREVRRLTMGTAVAKMARSKPKGANVPRDRKEPDLTDPRGQLGAYLRDWIDRKHGGDESKLADALHVTDRAVRKWCEGAAAPDLVKLNALAKAMGFSDWTRLGTAVTRFVESRQ